MQTSLASHYVQRVAESMHRTTAWPGTTSNTHRDPTTDQRLDDCANTLLATPDNLLHIPRHQLRTHQSQLRRIITIGLVLQLVSKLPVLHRAKLRHNIPTTCSQETIGRITYHTNIAYDSNWSLSSNRVRLGTTLDRSVRTGDPIVTRNRS